MSMIKDLYSTKFEVTGKVQGVYFRKHTHRKAEELGVRGWVMNTAHGSVIGEIQGPEPAFSRMKEWLAKVGSPRSRIDHARWSDSKTVGNYAYQDFQIRK